jgi:hypothetical protein
MMSRSTSMIFKWRVVAFLFLLAGWGWASGNFGSPFDPSFTLGLVSFLIHAIPMALLLLFGFNFLTGPSDQKWGAVGITVLAAVLFVASVILVVYGFLNPDPNSVGVHSLQDWIPTITTNIGTILWFVLVVPFPAVTRAERTIA